MTNELDMFSGGNLSVGGDLFDAFNDANKNLKSKGDGIRRISIRGGRWRKVVGGEEVEVSSADSMNIVIVNAATISRTYYKGKYNKDNPEPPVCWSPDGKIPDPKVPEETRQSARCTDCPQNIKGSGDNNSRACKFSQRVAVCVEGDYENVYQLSLPATSIFGEAENGHMPMGAYATLLAEKNAPAAMIVTEAYFDTNSEVPKLFFKPVRPLQEPELLKVKELLNAPETLKCIEMTVAQADGVQKIGNDSPVKEAATPTVPEDQTPADDEPVPEPQKAAKSEPPKVNESEQEMESLIEEWDG